MRDTHLLQGILGLTLSSSLAPRSGLDLTRQAGFYVKLLPVMRNNKGCGHDKFGWDIQLIAGF